MQFGDNPYELPTNAQLEDVLKKNTDHTNPLEMKNIKTDSGNKLFPFWVPVKDPEIEADEFKQYQDTKAKALDIKMKKDNVGIVQPKDAFNNAKTYDDSSLLDKVGNLIKDQNGVKVYDNSGVVKASNEQMTSTSTTKQVTDNDVSKAAEPKVEKAAKTAVGKVGVVKAKSDMPKQNIPSVDKKKAPKKEAKVGVVKAKADMGKQNIPKVEKAKAPKAEKGSKVGVVKPKDEMGKSDTSGINFDKYQTDHIKTA